MLEAARLAGAGAFILLSTALIYGEPLELPLREDHPCLQRAGMSCGGTSFQSMSRARSREREARSPLSRVNAPVSSPKGKSISTVTKETSRNRKTSEKAI